MVHKITLNANAKILPQDGNKGELRNNLKSKQSVNCCLSSLKIIVLGSELNSKTLDCQRTPSIKVVSWFRRRVRIKVISFLVFSKISFGSSEGQRRQFGAQTIDKLLTSILVTELVFGRENIWSKQKRKNEYLRISLYKKKHTRND